MKRMGTRWTTTFAAAALVALPAFGFAQTPQEQTPPQNPPQQTTPPPQTDPAAAPQSNLDAAKGHLAAARESLSQLTQLPAASQLQGEARTQVSQLIGSFNDLITTKTDWRASYAKVESNLNLLLGAAGDEPARTSGTQGAVGTSGTAPAIDPAIRAKLMEFRTNLDKFEEAAGGAEEPASTATPPPATPPSATPPSTTTPPPPDMPPSTPPTAATETAPPAVDAEELLNHVEAIEAILNAQAGAQPAGQTAVGTTSTATGAKATTGSDITLSQEQLETLRTHLTELRRLLERK